MAPGERVSWLSLLGVIVVLAGLTLLNRPAPPSLPPTARA